jgi:hypothetical protein
MESGQGEQGDEQDFLIGISSSAVTWRLPSKLHFTSFSNCVLGLVFEAGVYEKEHMIVRLIIRE